MFYSPSFYCVQVQIPGLEELQVFVPCGLMDQRPLILQLLNAAAGKDCSKEPEEIADDEAYLLMSKHRTGDSTADSDWAQWDGESLKLVPQMETVDTLSAMKVCVCACMCMCMFVSFCRSTTSIALLSCSQVEDMLLIVMQSAHLVAQRKAFQQSMEDVLTLSREQTSSQPLIASALEELKVLTQPQAMISDQLKLWLMLFVSYFQICISPHQLSYPKFPQY